MKYLHNSFIFIYSCNLYRILNKENIFEGFKEEKLYRKVFALFIGYKTKNIKKKICNFNWEKYNRKEWNLK